jgi:hypothetical protein
MSRFAPALRRIAGDLDLPPSVRSAILLEMAADLEALYEHHRCQGMGEAEAQRRAEESVLGSSEVLERLVQLHEASWRGWSEAVASRLTGASGLLLLALGVIPMFLLAAAVAVAAGVLGHPGTALVWPTTVAGLAVAGVVALEARRLLGGGRGAGRGLPLLLLLSAVAPALGMLGFLLELHALATLPEAGSADAQAWVAWAEQAGRGGALLLVGLLVGMAGALSWFLLLNRRLVNGAREVDALLGSRAVPPNETDGNVIPLVRRRRA